jgi:DNA-binding NtrC family response regulator
MQQARVLLIDLDKSSGLGSSLKESLLRIRMVANPVVYEAPELQDVFGANSAWFRSWPEALPDLIFLILPARRAIDFELFFQELKIRAPEVPLIVSPALYEQDHLLALLKMGANDFSMPPFQEQDIIPRLWRWIKPQSKEEQLVCSLKEKLGLRQLIGTSPVFLAELKKIPLMAKCDAGVLISGETGTGKELCARAIHYLSTRSRHPFIPVNCGAIPPELMENELFGHVAGAFTGATHSKPGLIEEAHQGTLLLDEIDCLSSSAQVKLLRFLQEKEYRQLGSTKVFQADVRVIAATNLDIAEAVNTGRIREDLYYRLDVIPLTLPALRERRDDIPLLADHFLRQYSRNLHKTLVAFDPPAMQKLLLHDWPGNVRELEYVVERAVLFCEDKTIKADHILFPRLSAEPPLETFKQAKAKVIDRFERSYIQSLLRVYNGNISRASQAARKNRRAFWQLMRKHHIQAEPFKLGQ